jgi:hypothetical protein
MRTNYQAMEQEKGASNPAVHLYRKGPQDWSTEHRAKDYLQAPTRMRFPDYRQRLVRRQKSDGSHLRLLLYPRRGYMEPM